MAKRSAVLVSGGGTNLQALIDAQQRNEPVPDGIGNFLHQQGKNKIRQEPDCQNLQRLFYDLPQIFKNNHHLPFTISNIQTPASITIIVYSQTV